MGVRFLGGLSTRTRGAPKVSSAPCYISSGTSALPKRAAGGVLHSGVTAAVLPVFLCCWLLCGVHRGVLVDNRPRRARAGATLHVAPSPLLSAGGQKGKAEPPCATRNTNAVERRASCDLQICVVAQASCACGPWATHMCDSSTCDSQPTVWIPRPIPTRDIAQAQPEAWRPYAPCRPVRICPPDPRT